MHGAVIYQCLTGSQVMNRPAKKYPLTVLRLLRHIAYNKPTQLLLTARHYQSSCSAKNCSQQYCDHWQMRHWKNQKRSCQRLYSARTAINKLFLQKFLFSLTQNMKEIISAPKSEATTCWRYINLFFHFISQNTSDIKTTWKINALRIRQINVKYLRSSKLLQWKKIAALG